MIFKKVCDLPTCADLTDENGILIVQGGNALLMNLAKFRTYLQMAEFEDQFGIPVPTTADVGKALLVNADGSGYEAKPVITPDATGKVPAEKLPEITADKLPTVPVAKGGTGATTAAQARANLGAMAAKTEAVTITASGALAAAHAEKVLLVNSESAVTLTIPAYTTGIIPVGSMITVTNIGTGSVDFAAADGVTINSKDSKIAIDGQFGAVSLYHSSTNNWILWGALA